MYTKKDFKGVNMKLFANRCLNTQADSLNKMDNESMIKMMSALTGEINTSTVLLIDRKINMF